MTPLLEVGAYAFSIHALGAIVSGLFVLTFGVYTAVTRPPTKGPLYLLLLTGVTSLWLFASGMTMGAPDSETAWNWWKAGLIGLGAIPAAVYGFSIWLAGRPDPRPHRVGWFVAMALAFEAVGIGTGWPSRGVALHDYGYYPVFGPGGLVLVAFLVGGFALSFWELRSVPPHRDPDQEGLRKGFRNFFLVPGVIIVLTNFAPAFGSGPPPIGYAIVIVGTAALFFTFSRFRLVDLTAATSAESMLEAVTDGVAVCDVAGRVRVSNPAFQTLVGMDESELIGSILPDSLSVGDDRDELVSLLAGDVKRERRLTIFPVGGSDPIPTTVTGHPFHDSAGERLGTVVIIRDLTDRIFFEERLTRSERLEAMGNLAGGVAHDFNNILMVVQGYAAILQEELGAHPMSSQVRKGLAEIVAGTERATELTKQLLTFGSTDVVEGKVHDVREALEECGPLLERLVSRDIDLRVLVPPVPAMVFMDPARMEKVLMNLALNARDAMPDGGILRIEAQVIAAGAEEESLGLSEDWYVAVRVSDTGTGMTPEVAARAFEPFFTTRSDGSGMGLSTVYGIVTQAGGKVDLQTEVGKGTTVTVYIPWHASEERGRHLTLLPPEVIRPGVETVVLVAEDNEAIRALTSTVLGRAGYTVHVAEDGQKAYDLAESLGFDLDLLVTDLVMPQIGGRELQRMLVEKRPNLVTLFMSGHPGDPLDLSTVGGARSIYLQKPFPPKALLQAAEDLVCGE